MAFTPSAPDSRRVAGVAKRAGWRGLPSAIRTLFVAVADRPVLMVGGIVAIAALVIGWYTTRMYGWEPDELGYTHLAITMGDSLRPIVTTGGSVERLNQLYPLTIAPFYALWGNVAAAFVAHVWNAILMASSAIPGYLLGREIFDRRWAAYLLAALTVAVPWVTLATVQLTEVAAFPTFLWAIVAVQRALVVPSPRRDLLAFAAIALACFARLQLVVLAPVFVLAVLVHEVGFALVGDAPRGRTALRDAWRRLIGPHAMVAVALAIGAFVVLPAYLSGLLARVFGFYGNTLEGQLIPPGTWELSRSFFVFMAVGVAVLPAVVSVGFVLDALIAPVRRRTHAFAVLLLLVGGTMTVQVGTVSVRFVGAVVQERYLMFLGPLMMAGLIAGLLDARRPVRAVLAGTAVVGVLVATTNYQSTLSAFWYLVSPGLSTFFGVVAPALRDVANVIGWGAVSELALLGLVTAVAGGLLALAVYRLPRTAVAAFVGAAVLVVCTTETVHALRRAIAFPGATTHGVDWIDAAASKDADVAAMAPQLGSIADARQTWWGTEYWNRSIKSAFQEGGPLYVWNPPQEIVLDRSGALRTTAPPKLVVTAMRGVPLMPVGRTIATSPDRKLELIRISPPFRARWSVRGVSDDGWLREAEPAVVRAFELARGCGRVAVTLSLSPGVGQSQRVALRPSTGPLRALTLAPGQRVRSVLAVCGRRGAAPIVSITAAPPLDTGQTVTPRLERVEVAGS